MIPDTEIMARLERLERDNRRLKRFGVAALLLAAALGAIAATQPVPDVIKAHTFAVVDAGGTVRGMMSTDNGDPELSFFGKQEGSIRLSLNHGPTITIESTKGVLTLTGGRQVGKLKGGPEFLLGGYDKYTGIIMGVEGGRPTIALANTKVKGGAELSLSPTGAPKIELSDPEGYTLDLGSTNTATPATGETQQTSAASITMFGNDKDHHVIWKAP